MSSEGKLGVRFMDTLLMVIGPLGTYGLIGGYIYIFLVHIIPMRGFGDWEMPVTAYFAVLFCLLVRSMTRVYSDPLEKLKRFELDELKELLNSGNDYERSFFKDRKEYEKREKERNYYTPKIKGKKKKKKVKKSGDIRYCSTCKVVKQEGTHHCRRCGKCIEEMDHHCIFLGTCIGRNNIAAFMSFVIYLGFGSYSGGFLILDEIISALFNPYYSNPGYIYLIAAGVLTSLGIIAFYIFAIIYLSLWSNDMKTFDYLQSDSLFPFEVPLSSVVYSLITFTDTPYTTNLFKNFSQRVKKPGNIFWP